MSTEVTLTVTQNYRRIARELRQAADGELRKEMAKAITSASRRAITAVKDSVRGYMPNRYAQDLRADLRLRTVRQSAGVRISAEADGRDVGAREKGSLRHPIYGRYRVSHRQKRFIERPWANQAIRPGFFTEPIEDHKDDIRDEIARAIQAVADKIAR